jgi:hypothetical protein
MLLQNEGSESHKDENIPQKQFDQSFHLSSSSSMLFVDSFDVNTVPFAFSETAEQLFVFIP